MKGIKFATIFLIILLLILGYVTFIKFTYKEDDVKENNKEFNSIALNTIVNTYNINDIISKIESKEVTTTASIKDNEMTIVYDNNKYNFTFENGILKNTTTITSEDDLNNIEKVFILLLDSISISKNEVSGQSILTSLMIIEGEYKLEGFEYLKTDNKVEMTLDTNKDIIMYEPSIIYDKLTILDIGTSNYKLSMLNENLIVTDFSYIENNNSYKVNIYYEPTDINNKILILKIYDKDKKELKNQEFSLKDITTNEFEIVMELNEIKVDDISSYSLEIKGSD